MGTKYGVVKTQLSEGVDGWLRSHTSINFRSGATP
jgi:hypothetical protein